MVNHSLANGGGGVAVVGSGKSGPVGEGVESGVGVFGLVLPPCLVLGLGVDAAGSGALFGGGFESPEDLALFGGGGVPSGCVACGGVGCEDYEDWAC